MDFLRQRNASIARACRITRLGRSSYAYRRKDPGRDEHLERPRGFAVVGHTGRITASVSNGQTIDCARVLLSRVRVVGHNGVVIHTGYVADLEAGTVTFTDVTGYSQPVTTEHRIEDQAVVRDVQINGEISFTRPLTHTYPLASPGDPVSTPAPRFTFGLPAGSIRWRP